MHLAHLDRNRRLKRIYLPEQNILLPILQDQNETKTKPKVTSDNNGFMNKSHKILYEDKVV